MIASDLMKLDGTEGVYELNLIFNDNADVVLSEILT